MTLFTTLNKLQHIYKMLVLMGLKEFDNEGMVHLHHCILSSTTLPICPSSAKKGLGLDLECIWATTAVG
jgi:hypothetical protein